MERRMRKVILKKGNNIELPDEVLKALKIKTGDEMTLIYIEGMIVVMPPEKFGEKILKN
ncbi:MAG: hypothetical protein K2O23_04115 [Anaeroplasmataceae bacterium]|nr:hypothetical protein [Anaeroplasmataceae bacterium]